MTKNLRVEVAHSEEELEDVFGIRREVFVEEQKVDEVEEYDNYESSSTHLLAYLDGKPCGTCRFRHTDEGVKLERFAVKKSVRGNGIGNALLNKALDMVDSSNHIYLHAQVGVVDFYAQHGFIKIGGEFEEANIRHFKMVYYPDQA